MITYNIGICIPTFNRDGKIILNALNSAYSNLLYANSMLRIENRNDEEYKMKIFLCSDTEQLEEHVLAVCKEFEGVEILKYFSSGFRYNNYANTPRQLLIEETKKERIDYILFLDDDNVIFPNYVYETHNKLIKDGVDFVISEIFHNGPLIQEYGNPPVVLKGSPVMVRHIDTLQFFLKSRVMYEHGWDQNSGYIADGVTFESIGNKYTFSYTNKILGVHL